MLIQLLLDGWAGQSQCFPALRCSSGTMPLHQEDTSYAQRIPFLFLWTYTLNARWVNKDEEEANKCLLLSKQSCREWIENLELSGGKRTFPYTLLSNYTKLPITRLEIVDILTCWKLLIEQMEDLRMLLSTTEHAFIFHVLEDQCYHFL